ncbi:MAG: hypothetical protein HQM13_19320 [SAR324 cluster bacterium]|nr:hypothetical protein [SAR324 cluster bacterium]
MSYNIKIDELDKISLETRKEGTMEDGYYIAKDFYGSEKYVIVQVLKGDDKILRAWDCGQSWAYHLEDPDLDLRGPIQFI